MNYVLRIFEVDHLKEKEKKKLAGAAGRGEALGEAQGEAQGEAWVEAQGEAGHPGPAIVQLTLGLVRRALQWTGGRGA